MADTKTYDYSTDVGKVRFFGAEKDVTTTQYTDDEIQGLLDEADGDIHLATSLLWEAKASLASNSAAKNTVGGVTTDTSVTAQYALNMADHFRKKAGSEPCADFAEIGGTDQQKRDILINHREDYW